MQERRNEAKQESLYAKRKGKKLKQVDGNWKDKNNQNNCSKEKEKCDIFNKKRIAIFTDASQPSLAWSLGRHTIQSCNFAGHS